MSNLLKSALMTASLISAGLLMACSAADTAATSESAPQAKQEMQASKFDGAKLQTILAAQDEKTQARYDARRPAQTLEFFGIEPGMTVAEVLPGGGYYTKILLPYLGDQGMVYGVDYTQDMWAHFGGFATPEFLEAKKTWPATWTQTATEWRSDGDANVGAFTFSGTPDEVNGTVDAVLMIRAVHHLNRFQDKSDYYGQALKTTHDMLKPGGIVGVVQHRGAEGSGPKIRSGNSGYLVQSDVIAAFDKAGFDLVKSSEINANPLDTASEDDMVWRLPPTLATSRDDAELKAKMEAIGESDRMTLLFKKR